MSEVELSPTLRFPRQPTLENTSIYLKESKMEYTPKKLSCRDCGAEWASQTQLRKVRRLKGEDGSHKAKCPACGVPMTVVQAGGSCE